MTDISDSIYYFGEIGMQEFEGSKAPEGYARSGRLPVELGGAGMPTNIWAEYGKGRPKIAIVTEIDALPAARRRQVNLRASHSFADAPGHMEGHNTHGGVAAMAAFAVKQVMQHHNIPGTVALSYGPAEEQLASRPFIVRAGYFKDVDAVIYLHIRDTLNTGFGIGNYAAISSVFTFHGKTSAWRGQSVGWQGCGRRRRADGHGLRQAARASQPTYRAHRTITAGGIQPNIIADKGQIWWFVRDASMPARKRPTTSS
jgi:aminobenzoyl-glutamate utilization protein B